MLTCHEAYDVHSDSTIHNIQDDLQNDNIFTYWDVYCLNLYLLILTYYM